MHNASIRVALEQPLNLPVTDELMEFLMTQGYIEDAEIDARDINELADIARSVIRAGSGVSGGREAPPMLRRETVRKNPAQHPFSALKLYPCYLAKKQKRRQRYWHSAKRFLGAIS